MIADTLLTFADGVAAGDTGTRIVGDSVDLRGMGTASGAGLNSMIGSLRDVGAGQPVYLQVSVDEAFLFAGTTDHSYTVKFVTGNDSNLSDFTVLASSTNPSTTDIALGTKLLQITLPMEGTAYKRYVGVQEVVVGTTTTGKLNAYLSIDPSTGTKVYADSAPGFTAGD